MTLVVTVMTAVIVNVIATVIAIVVIVRVFVVIVTVIVIVVVIAIVTAGVKNKQTTNNTQATERNSLTPLHLEWSQKMQKQASSLRKHPKGGQTTVKVSHDGSAPRRVQLWHSHRTIETITIISL